ncbi:MAG: 4-(cytidine 5'-diphospho)-2-C-methyl-D-erythritol kinase [Treponema sp.]|nr:4-(cytidine 5'-diphospho)-2-C-methyl-D-erythritol kinase [Treponema sp.]
MPENIEQLIVLAPAKINLHLAVKAKRPDGFHDLESIFLAVNLYDILHFQLINDDNSTEITMKSGENLAINADFDSIPVRDNIIFRAITLFREKTGYSKGLKINVEKRIPPGGGLGGGSSNAAVTLLTLNKIAGFPCCQEALLEMAVILGSDVSFFIHQTPAAWVTGRGEHIQPIEAPSMYLVLINPGFPSNTSSAFRLLDEYRYSNSSGNKNLTTEYTEFHGDNNLSILKTPCSSVSSVVSHSSWLSHINLCNNKLVNDFLDVFPGKERTVYNEIISQLMEQGAEYANLSGAGSTCFGVFKTKEQTQNAVKSLQGKWPFIQECCSINKIDGYF